MSLSTIILESGGVFAHNTNQDGSGNIGVNVENTPTVVISGTPSVSVSNFPSSQAVTSPDLTTSGLGDTGTYTASFAGTSHTNSNAKGALIGIILGTVSGTNVNLELDLQWSPDDGTTWVSMGILRSSTFTAAISSNQIFTLATYPTSQPPSPGYGGNYTTSQLLPLPKTWRINYVITGTSPSVQLATTNYWYLY